MTAPVVRARARRPGRHQDVWTSFLGSARGRWSGRPARWPSPSGPRGGGHPAAAWIGTVTLEMSPGRRARPQPGRCSTSRTSRRRRTSLDALGELVNMIGGNVKSLLPSGFGPRAAHGRRRPLSRPVRPARRAAEHCRADLPGPAPPSWCGSGRTQPRRKTPPHEDPHRRRQPRDAPDRHPHPAPGRATTATTSSRPRTATDGFDAVRDHRPDLVLSDWNMPEMTGIELLRRLRANGPGRPVRLRHLRGLRRRWRASAHAGRCAVPDRQAVHPRGLPRGPRPRAGRAGGHQRPLHDTRTAAKAVRDMLTDLLGRTVEVRRRPCRSRPGRASPSPSRSTSTTRRSFAAVGVADLRFSACVARRSASSLHRPPTRRSRTGALSDTLAENLHEVLNIAASLLNAEAVEHVRLDQMLRPRHSAAGAVAACVQALGRRLDLGVDIAGYGKDDSASSSSADPCGAPRAPWGVGGRRPGGTRPRGLTCTHCSALRCSASTWSDASGVVRWPPSSSRRWP